MYLLPRVPEVTTGTCRTACKHVRIDLIHCRIVAQYWEEDISELLLTWLTERKYTTG
jgi:hypothetical protein